MGGLCGSSCLSEALAGVVVRVAVGLECGGSAGLPVSVLERVGGTLVRVLQGSSSMWWRLGQTYRSPKVVVANVVSEIFG